MIKLKWTFKCILFCTMSIITLASCSSDNDENSSKKVQPLDDPDMEALRQKVLGVWVDTENVELFGYARSYAFDEDGDVECMYSIPVNDDDIIEIKDKDIQNVHFTGTWKVIDDIKDRWTGSNENFIGLALELKITGYESEGVERDTLFVDVDDTGACSFMSTDELDQLVYQASLSMTGAEMEEARAMGRAYMMRGIWDKIKGALAYAGSITKTAWNKVILPAAKKVGEVVIEAGKNILSLHNTMINAALKVLTFDFTTMTVKPSLADWMGGAYPTAGTNDPLLSDISMPGTHDTFTFGMNSRLGALEGKTQMYNIKTQWELGVRCFDLRINTLEKMDKITSIAGYGLDQSLGIFHGPIYLQKTLRSGMEDIVEMVKKHPTETAIVIMKFENHENEKNIAEINRTLNENFKDRILTNPTKGLRLSQCRGKVVIIQRYDESKSTFSRIHAKSWPEDGKSALEFSGDKSTEDLYVQDLYEVPKGLTNNQFWDKKTEAFEKVIKLAAGENNKNTWFVNHESAYVGLINYAANASQMIPRIEKILDKDEYKNKRVGIVVTDFVGYKGLYDVRFSTVDCSKLTPKIIIHNTKQ